MFRLWRGGGRSSEAGWSPSCGQVPTTRAFLAGRPGERASAGTRDPPKRLMREKSGKMVAVEFSLFRATYLVISPDTIVRLRRGGGGGGEVEKWIGVLT